MPDDPTMPRCLPDHVRRALVQVFDRRDPPAPIDVYLVVRAALLAGPPPGSKPREDVIIFEDLIPHPVGKRSLPD